MNIAVEHCHQSIPSYAAPHKIQTCSFKHARLRIRLRNIGPRARYRIVATHVAQVLRTTPAEVDVEEGAETFVTVTVPVPADASPGSRLEVMVTASGDDARETTNYVMRQLTVGK